MMRELTFSEAINEALYQALELSDQVIVIGQLVNFKPAVFGTTSGLVQKFGPKRVHDFPVSESLMTSTGLGAALAGMRPVLVHHRMDFMLYSLDAIANWLSLWRFKANGQSSAPVTIRAVVGKGWGQGPQHSKSLHGWFAHLPGIRVAVPATPHDAKGLLLESIFGEDPCIIVENRSLFSMKGVVPENPYRVPFGRSVVRRTGRDLTIAAIGMMVPLAIRAANEAAMESIDVEVLDMRTVAPLDIAGVIASVEKTGRLIVADPSWQRVNVGSEIVSGVVEKIALRLRASPLRISLPQSHAPMSAALEEQYYPSEKRFLENIRAVMSPKI